MKERPLAVVEYAQFGDLLGYLRKSRGMRDNYYSDPSIKPITSLTSKQLLKFAWEISDGMEYLSMKKVNQLNIWQDFRITPYINYACVHCLKKTKDRNM